MAINLKKNEKALLQAYNDVLNDKSDTNWAVFGYEGNSNDLKVVETGDGGLEEMTDELSGGKVQYAFVRVTDPNTQLPKNVLVNWSGEGVPSNRRGVCARHTTDIARFFRGAHVTINARSEMDLEEDSVLEKVAKASGANFSFHKEKARPMPEAGPVGSVYKKADPNINVKARDTFWTQQDRQEEMRKTEEKKSAIEIRQQEERERRQRESQEAASREQRSQERARRIDEQKRFEREQDMRERETREAALQSRLKQRESEIESEREREKLESQRRRVQEHSTISSAVREKKYGFEQKAEEQVRPPPSRPPKGTPRAPPPLPHEPEPEYEAEPEPEYEAEPEPEPEIEYPPEPDQPLYDDVDEQQQQYPSEPQRGLDDETQEEPDVAPYYDQQEEVIPDEPVQPMYDDVGEQEEPEQPLYDDAETAAGGSEDGLCARTIYDYEAADETEISFDVDEIITHIEQIDEGWWRGVRQLDGSYGLFPANYVELI